LLLTIAAGCLAGAAVGIKAHSHRLADTADRLESTVKSEQGALGVLAMLKRERDELIKQVELKRDLMPSVSYSQALASLTAVLPPQVAVSELVLRSVHPAPEPIETEAERQARRARPAKPTADGETEPYEPNLIGIELRGLAADDSSVARLVSRMDEHPLFSRVTMRSSRGVQKQGLEAREFSLTATIDLDRRFEWVPGQTEVADAD
jgi:hypothetical protein